MTILHIISLAVCGAAYMHLQSIRRQRIERERAMSYFAEHRSEKNWHEFPREPLIGSATICTGSCQRCGDQFEAGGKWVSVGEWITRLREGYGGCVALPAPAVSGPERDNLPVVSGE